MGIIGVFAGALVASLLATTNWNRLVTPSVAQSYLYPAVAVLATLNVALVVRTSGLARRSDVYEMSYWRRMVTASMKLTALVGVIAATMQWSDIRNTEDAGGAVFGSTTAVLMVFLAVIAPREPHLSDRRYVEWSTVRLEKLTVSKRRWIYALGPSFMAASRVRDKSGQWGRWLAARCLSELAVLAVLGTFVAWLASRLWDGQSAASPWYAWVGVAAIPAVWGLAVNWVVRACSLSSSRRFECFFSMYAAVVMGLGAAAAMLAVAKSLPTSVWSAAAVSFGVATFFFLFSMFAVTRDVALRNSKGIRELRESLQRRSRSRWRRELRKTGRYLWRLILTPGLALALRDVRADMSFVGEECSEAQTRLADDGEMAV
ncbi:MULTISPECIES: hypothetical protein [Gordonia]|uniref:hypothetical protein n=1 Tax=Gordonia TaxID=2053 RepID=UPI0025810201|nr:MULTISPECIES: hypothetical protein [Gordonia]